MIKYFIKRILVMIPMLLVVTFIVFTLTSMSSVNPGRSKLGAEATEEQVASSTTSWPGGPIPSCSLW